MNRQQRRARRAAPAVHDPACGCQQRYLRAVEYPAPTCPLCGQPAPAFVGGEVPWPTASPVGSTIHVEVGCVCGHEYRAAALVTD